MTEADLVRSYGASCHPDPIRGNNRYLYELAGWWAMARLAKNHYSSHQYHQKLKDALEAATQL